MKNSIRPACAAALIAVFIAATTSDAAYILVDDFETPPHTLSSSIGGVNGWTVNNGTGNVVADPVGGSNQVLDASGAAVSLSKGLSLGNSTGTLFFRARATEPVDTESASDISVGLSDAASPTGFGDFEAQLAFVNVGGGAVIPGEARARDAGTNHIFSFDHSTWYNVWMVIDNSTDLYEVYVGGGAFGTQTQLDDSGETKFTFRNTAGDGVNSNTTPVANDLMALFLRGGNSHRGAFYVDDVYFDAAGANLANPIPEPATIAMLFLGGLMALGLLRRHR